MVANYLCKIVFAWTVLSFATLHAGWLEPPVNVENVADEINLEPEIAIDPQGNAVAVWTSRPLSSGHGDNSLILASFYLLSTNTWSIPVVISSNELRFDTAHSPQVGVDDNGNAQAIWIQSEGNLIGIFASTYTFATHSWSTPTAIETHPFSTTDVSHCHIAVAPSGLGSAVWALFVLASSPPTFVRASTFNGTTWASPVTISPTTGSFGGVSPDVGISDAGISMAVWAQDTPGGGRFINGAQGSAHNMWTVFASPVSGPLVVGDGNENPSLAVDPIGNAKAVWYCHQSSTGNNTHANSFYGGTWHNVVTLQSGATMPLFFPYLFDIGSDANGNCVAIWIWRKLGDTASVMVSTSLAKTNVWSTPLALAVFFPFGYDPHLGDAVGVNANGDAAVVWSQPSEISVFYETNARNYNFATNTWSDTFRLSDPAFYSTLDPRVAGTSGIGNPIAIWAADNAIDRVNIQATIYAVLPLPPSNFAGSNLKNHFATQTDYINKLTWTPSSDPSVTSYVIYEGADVVARVPASGPFEVLIHNRNKKQAYTYTLYAVNDNGKSPPVTVTVPPASS